MKIRHLVQAILLIMICHPLFSQEITQPTGKSDIYFYRIPNYVGSSIKMTILIDKEPVVRLEKNSFYRHTVSAGDHEFSFLFGSPMKLRLKTEPGKSYYVRCSVNMGFWSGIPVMELMETSSGKAIIDGHSLIEQFFTPISTEPPKSHIAISMGGGVGFEKMTWFVNENNDDVTLSTGGGYNIGAEYGYLVNRNFDISLNCSFIGSSLSQTLSNASGAFNRMGLTITPSLVIPIKGGSMFRLKAGAGAGLYSFGTMKIDASELGDKIYIFKYKSAPGFHVQLLFESNFAEKGAMGFGLRYENIRYEYTTKGSNSGATDPLVLNPDGSGLIFFINYSFLF
jgi:hypothetical protein